MNLLLVYLFKDIESHFPVICIILMKFNGMPRGEAQILHESALCFRVCIIYICTFV